MKFVFQDAKNVSSGYKEDKLSITVNPFAKKYFMSNDTNLQLSIDSDMTISIPPQIFGNLTEKEIKKSVD